MTFTASDSWVVYSPNESAVSDSSGFWSNEFGWVPLDQATCITTDEARGAMLPISVGHDARLLPWLEAQQFYG